MYFVNLEQQLKLILKIVLECRTFLTFKCKKSFTWKKICLYLWRDIQTALLLLFLEDLLCDLHADVKRRASPVSGICIFNYCFKNVPKRYISFHPASLLHSSQYVLHLNFSLHKSINYAVAIVVRLFKVLKGEYYISSSYGIVFIHLNKNLDFENFHVFLVFNSTVKLF